MKHLSIALLLSIIVVFSCKKEEEKTPTLALGDFEMSTDVVTHNKPITISYNGEDENMDGFYYLLNGYKSYPEDLNFENGKATITVPDSISAIAFNLKVDGKYMNNEKKGYVFTVKDTEGNNLPGSNSTMEYYKMTTGENYGIKGNAEVMIESLQKDVEANPEIKEAWGNTYLRTMYRNDRKKGEAIANTLLADLSAKKEMTEEDYSKMRSIYMMTRKNELADSISKIAIAKYPKGKLKQQVLMNSFYDAKSAAEKEKIFAELEAEYKMDGNLSYAATSIAAQKFKDGDEEGFKLFANKIKSDNDKAGLYNSVAWPAAESGKNLEMASQLSKSSLELINAAKKDLSKKPAYFTKKQYVKNLEGTYNMYADTYALIQFKLGNVKEAIEYQKQAIGEGNDPELNERYIQFLMADKQYELASKKANQFLNKGKSTAKITEYYKTAYLKANPNTNAKDFDVLIADIKEKSRQKELVKLKEDMIDEEAPQFVLKNLDGENVSLTELKGKTVILDFWATWCGPCKASFPGMQEVVEKYKDDKDVVLLFVDTFEDGANREKDVAKFIKDNKYDFHVLIDGKVKDSNDYEVAKKYGITGIPTKVIIGPSGKINFKSVGFSGSNDKLKQEMDLMIELLKSS